MTPAQQEAQRKHIEATSEWHEAMGQCQRATAAKNNADMKLAAAKNKLTKAEADVMRALSAGAMTPGFYNVTEHFGEQT